MSDIEGIKVMNPLESITEKSNVLIEPETSRSIVLQKLEPGIPKIVVLMKPDTVIQKSISQGISAPKTSGSNLLK